MQLFEFLFPGTSSLYAHNQSCAYVISADEDKVVNVTFLEFHLEDHNDHCHDWLQIHDGRDSTAHLIGRFCGTNNPPNFVSTTNKVYMWFDSDGMNLLLFIWQIIIVFLVLKLKGLSDLISAEKFNLHSLCFFPTD